MAKDRSSNFSCYTQFDHVSKYCKIEYDASGVVHGDVIVFVRACFKMAVRRNYNVAV